MHLHEQSPVVTRAWERGRIRARLRRRRSIGAVVSVLLGFSVLIGANGTASADPSAGDWLKLRTCESGGDYSINTGNGYYGAYQFDLGTWQSVGGAGLPSDASPATQDALAYKLWQERGWSPWTCASIVGLPVGGSGGPAPVEVIVTERMDGHFDAARLTADGVHMAVTGWAADLNSSGGTSSVRITLNNAATVLPAGFARADVDRVMHISGAHGFVAEIPAVAGSYRVCVTALGRSTTKALGCRAVNVPAAVRGSNRISSASGARAVVTGWAYDNSASGNSTRVIVKVDNRLSYNVPANQYSADVSAAFNISGSHRYSAAIGVGAGAHSVCVTAVGIRSSSRSLGCAVVSFAAPHGYVQSATGSAGRVHLLGWGFDPNESARSVVMKVVVNGSVYRVPTGLVRADVDQFFGIGGNHGFAVTLLAHAGRNSVCVYTMSSNGSQASLASCRTITV